MKKLSSILAIGLFILTACAPASQTSAGPLFATPSPQPTALKVLPTPSSPGDPITWDNLQVTMDELEVTQDYMTDYGSSRIPPAGQKFLLVNIRLENGGQNEMEVPI